MKEYYCLLLNNSYDTESHWVSLKPFSVAPNILEKDIKDLSLLENEFMDLDNTIIQEEESYHVLGSFPIFGEIKDDGKMYDVITGRLIREAKTPKEAIDLSYKAKYKADSMMVEEMLTLIDEESKERYCKYLNDLAYYSKKVFHNVAKPSGYYVYRLNNSSLNKPLQIAKVLNNEVIDCITKEKIDITPSSDKITSHLSTKYITEISERNAQEYQVYLLDNDIEKYIDNVKSAKTNSVNNYNTFIALNKDHPKTKIRLQK